MYLASSWSREGCRVARRLTAMANERTRGRGASDNPTSRFALIELERDPEFFAGSFADEAGVRPRTQFWEDHSKTLISRNDSPDIPMEFTANPYRGCEHGCSYCYARPTHEYLGYSAGLDFETQILVKRRAPELLREHFRKRSWQPRMVALSGVTDPYQPVERRLELTRRCLEVFLEFRNPVQLITKNHLITRDLDLLAELARLQLVRVHLSMTTLDPELSRLMEPRASIPARRLLAIEKLARAGIPTTVMASPMIAGLNDHELPEILSQAARAGARAGGYIPLRLPGNVQAVFVAWLEEHFPLRKEKILSRIRDMREGKLNDSNFHTRFRGQGKAAEHLAQLFQLALRRSGLTQELPPLRIDLFRRPPQGRQQLDLFS